jgi:methionyl aminopeptidase
MSDPAGRDAMRAVGQLAAQALALAGSMAVPGTTTDAIDAAVHAFLIERGAYPSPLHYHGFPKSTCTSVNEVVCHGVPDDRPLAEGDLVNVDVTAYLGGFHGDTNATYCIGMWSDVCRCVWHACVWAECLGRSVVLEWL